MVPQPLDEVIYELSIIGQDLQKDVMLSPDPVDFIYFWNFFEF